MSEKIKISILAANPADTNFLALNEEFRRIQGLQRGSQLRDKFEVRYHPELRANELQEIVLDAQFKPNIIHFCGHGESNGVKLTDDSGKKSHIVTKDVLADLFKLCKPDLHAVVLNACYSEDDADAIVAQVPFFIGMNDAIKDKAAIRFSEGFYNAIFNQTTLDIKKAYDAGINKMGIANIAANECLKPVLRMPPFIPHYKQDIFVCFAEADKDWTEGFAEKLKEQLQKQLCPDGNLVVCIRSDFENIEASAVVLLIVSHAFVQISPSNLKSLERLVNRNHPIYLIERQPVSLPEVLKGGLNSKEFWRKSDDEGLVPLVDKRYLDKLKEVVNDLRNKLIELKSDEVIIKVPDIKDKKIKIPESPPEVKEVKKTPPKPPTKLPKREEKILPPKEENIDTKTGNPLNYKKWGIGGTVLVSALGLGSLVFPLSKPAEPPAPATVTLAPEPPPAALPSSVDCTNCPEMVTIPAGSFIIGSGDTNDDEKSPPYKINIKEFRMGKYEVTREQFAVFVKETNYDAGNSCSVYMDGSWSKKEGYNWRTPGFNQTGKDPVVCVSWDDAKAYVDWLSNKTKQKYRLPSEAEWEYACRGGEQHKYCGSDDVDKVAVYGKKYGFNTKPVGELAKNRYGLYDMSGNVWEWVGDWYHDKYSNGIPSDGTAWETGGEQKYRVLRGGSWNSGTDNTRAANRGINSPENRFNNNGFRVARTVP